jgi:hypothetical protein
MEMKSRPSPSEAASNLSRNLVERVHELAAEADPKARVDVSAAVDQVTVLAKLRAFPTIDYSVREEAGWLAGREDSQPKCAAAAQAAAQSARVRDRALEVARSSSVAMISPSWRHSLEGEKDAFRHSETCGKCGGDGEVSCGSCGGDGKKTCWACSGSGRSNNKSCASCGGDGKTTCGTCGGDGDVKCSRCNGTGGVTFYFSYAVLLDREVKTAARGGSKPELLAIAEQWVLKGSPDERREAPAPVVSEVSVLEGQAGYFSFEAEFFLGIASLGGKIAQVQVESEMLGMPVIHERHSPFQDALLKALATRISGLRDADTKIADLLALARSTRLGAALAEASFRIDDSSASELASARKGALTVEAAKAFMAPIAAEKVEIARRAECVAWPIAAAASLLYSTLFFATNLAGYLAFRHGVLGFLLATAIESVALAPLPFAIAAVRRTVRRDVGPTARAALGPAAWIAMSLMLGASASVVILPATPWTRVVAFEAADATAETIGIDPRSVRHLFDGALLALER